MTAQEVGEIFPRGAAAELLGALIKRSRAWWVFGIPAEVLTEVTARLITLPGCVFWLDQQMSTVLTVRQSQGWGPDMCRDLVAMLPPSANAVGVLPQAVTSGQISAALKGFPGLMAFPSKKWKNIILFGATGGTGARVDIPTLLFHAIEIGSPPLAEYLRGQELAP